MTEQRKATRGIFEKVPGLGEWWIRFTDSASRYRREKAGSFAAARKLLDKRRGEAVAGKKLGNLRARTVLFKEIGDDALVYSRANERSHRDDACRMTKLVEMFGTSPANDLVGHEMEQRLNAVAKSEGWAASTFNHYRSLLMPLGAPFGGTMRGGHQGSEPLRVSLITPPNFGGGAGSCFPSMLVVALAEPGVPVTCCAAAGVTATKRNIRETATG
jgi:hypothetical protein